jgi:uncharacterized protein YegP (UPF0339 family)
MKNAVTISKQKPASSSMDYAFLRAEGMKWIERYGSDLWTDYNTHDPGITIMELLSYAITDLGYRTSFSLTDLLSTQKSNGKNFKSQFYSARKILPTRPVSEIDLRKLFIGADGVKNAWLLKADEELFVDIKNEQIAAAQPDHDKFYDIHLNGIYDVKVELDMKATDGTDWDDARRQEVFDKLRACFHEHRNLCEDLRNIELIEEQKIRICADVEIKPMANASEVYAEILYRVQNYLSPDVKQYTLAEMRELRKSDGNPYRMDEIFNGPVLKYGFIPDEEVKQSKLKRKVFLSDIISIMMDVEHVIAVKEVKFNFCSEDKEIKNEWMLCIDKGKKPGLCLDKMALHFYKDVVPVNAGKQKAIELFQQKMEADRLAKKNKTYDDYIYAKGIDRQVNTYRSLRNDLPLVYGVSDHGLPAHADVNRRSQARQLKGYLVFYDQLLGNYLAQLHHVKDLLRLQKTQSDVISPQSYFYQKLADIGEEEIAEDEIIINTATYANSGGSLAGIVSNFEKDTNRLNRFTDHLLSRFAEQFTDYVTQLYALSEHVSESELLAAKIQLLNEYPALSKNRAGAYNYTASPVWESDNVSGLEHKLCRLLGISNYFRHNISTITSEVTEEINNGTAEYVFRIADPEQPGRTLLSSKTKYATKQEAENAFAQAMQHAALRDYYEVKQASDGRYHFNVIDEKGELLARRIEFFATAAVAEAAILKLMLLVKDKYSNEGLFVVEHLLLRMDAAFLKTENELFNKENFLPVCTDADCEDCEQDPYSFRITVVLPAETIRFKNFDFRKQVEHLIRQQTPAHIYPKICWVNNAQLKEFETAWRLWLTIKQEARQNTPEGLIATRELIRILFNLRSMMQSGVLPDCGEPPENPLILGRTSLGNL